MSILLWIFHTIKLNWISSVWYNTIISPLSCLWFDAEHRVTLVWRIIFRNVIYVLSKWHLFFVVFIDLLSADGEHISLSPLNMLLTISRCVLYLFYKLEYNQVNRYVGTVWIMRFFFFFFNVSTRILH